MRSKAICILFIFLGQLAFAEEAEIVSTDKIFSEVTIKKVDNPSDFVFLLSQNYLTDCSGLEITSPNIILPQFKSQGRQVQQVALDLIGKLFWKIIDESRAILNIKSQTVNVLPRGAKCWTDLDSWQPPTSHVYEVSYKNLMGFEVIKYKFRISYIYGGKYKNKGTYLANVSITPELINVLPGFELDSSALIKSAFNLNTTDDPLAGITFEVNWKAGSSIKKTYRSILFMLDGEGNLQKLSK